MTGMKDSPAARPLILDFDASVLPLGAGESRIPLDGWQEKIRFGCGLRAYAGLETHLDRLLPPAYGCVFTGSGDYHHLSLFLLKRLARDGGLGPASLDLAVCDNHPDNMRYPFGLHCGSWVRHAAGLACVRQIHVVGITSPDIGPAHAWENYLLPFARKKLFYWSVGRRANWLALLGRGEHGRAFDSADALLAALVPVLRESPALYLSVDKDVFDPAVARGNWDQGIFRPEHMEAVIRSCASRLVGCDITGEASTYAYAGRFKRFLSRLDGQKTPEPGELESWQADQQQLNIRLLDLLQKVY
ncbi:MAG: hypothetical protein LBV01_03340 [Deltaproteobacteria bacterium]|jgi:hypothetical protein|nr:hypothetical protein [Deltaproteobacteria bacterium]